MVNRYLVTTSGGRTGSRVLPTLLTFGGLVGPFFLFGLFGVVSDTFVNGAHQGDVLAVGLVASIALFVGTVVLVWVWLFRSTGKLREAEALALSGDVHAKEGAHYALARVFRTDVRLRAFYVLGLLAERLGDFADAADLFTRAGKALPVTLGTRAGKRIPLMCLGHGAFCHAAAGNLPVATAQLQEAHRRIPNVYTQGIFESLMDDSAYLGSASMAGNLNEIEARRDPRAMVALAGALLAFRNGHYRACVDAVAAEDGMLRQNLMPHEGELVESLKAEAVAKLAGGEYRSGAAASPLSEWAARARGGPRATIKSKEQGCRGARKVR